MAAYPVTVVAGGLHHCDRAWTTGRGQATDVHRIYLPLSGSARVALGSTWTELAPGLLYFIPAHASFGHACERRMDVHWMHLRMDDPELARCAARVGAVRSWPSAQWRWAEPALARVGEHFAGGDAALAASVHAVAIAVTAAAIDTVGADALGAAEGRARFRPSLALIERRYPASVPAAELAGMMGMSEVHFRRAFRRARGAPPHAYLARLRFESAVAQLVGTREPIARIAEACGFPDAFYFSRAFKRQFRMSPQRFRRARQRAP